MGQHLQLYASNNVTLEQARTWCKWRAVDIIEAPPPSDVESVGMVGREMWKLTALEGEGHIEHGHHAAVCVLSFLVWRAAVIDGDLIRAFCVTVHNHNLPSEHVIEWLARHLGCVVWGDNDGV